MYYWAPCFVLRPPSRSLAPRNGANHAAGPPRQGLPLPARFLRQLTDEPSADEGGPPAKGEGLLGAAAAAAEASASLRDLELCEFSLKALLLAGPSELLLARLDLSWNRLKALPGLEALAALVSLDISHNRFRTLPERIGALRCLESLNAAHNQLNPRSWPAAAIPIEFPTAAVS